MPASKKDPDVLAFARERRAAGLSLEQIAAELVALQTPVTAMTLSRWLAEPGAPKETRGPKRKAEAQRFQRRQPSEPPAASTLPPEDEPLIDFMRRQLRTMQGDAEQARVANPVLYQRLVRDMVILSNNLARAEREQPGDDGDSFTFTRKEIEQAIPALLEKMAGWVDRCQAVGGLLCARCSRELSVELGRPGEPPAL
jgi:hypothetical protein